MFFYSGGVLQVLTVLPQSSGFTYLVHYDGWNKKYDEVLAEDRIFEITEASTEEMIRLRDAAKAAAPPGKPDKKRSSKAAGGDRSKKSSDGSDDDDVDDLRDGEAKPKQRRLEKDVV